MAGGGMPAGGDVLKRQVGHLVVPEGRVCGGGKWNYKVRRRDSLIDLLSPRPALFHPPCPEETQLL